MNLSLRLLTLTASMSLVSACSILPKSEPVDLYRLSKPAQPHSAAAGVVIAPEQAAGQ